MLLKLFKKKKKNQFSSKPKKMIFFFFVFVFWGFGIASNLSLKRTESI